MRTAERNRIDRLPTRGERWTGIILSALLALLFLPAAVFVSVIAIQNGSLHVRDVLVITVLGSIGVLGASFFYRFCFTEPRAASHRAQHIYAWVAVIVGVSLAVLMMVRPTTPGQAFLSLALLVSAVGTLASSRILKATRAKRR